MKLEEEAFHAERTWDAKNAKQRYFLELFTKHRNEAKKLKNIETTAERDKKNKNRIIVESVLDMLVHWIEEGELSTIRGKDGHKHAGFEIEKNHCTVYYPVAGYSHIAELRTKSGDSLWLTMPEQAPSGEVDLASAAFTIMSQETHLRAIDYPGATVRVPDVDLDLKPNISFLLDLSTQEEGERAPSVIDEATQTYRLKINKKGAHVKVVTTMGMLIGAGISEQIEILTFDRPFIGWFTQPDAPELPIAVFYADYCSWKKVEDLEI